jgi:gliding motility-associated-like protein
VSLVAINSHGCKDTAYGHVKMLGYAGAFTYAPLLGCAPMQVNFTANVSNVPSLTWDYADGNVSPASPATTSSHVYTEPGAYVPKLILSDSTGCQASSLGLDTIKIDGFKTGYTYQPNPACEKATTQFVDTSYSYFSTVTNWHWTFDDGQMSFVNNPSHYYDSAGVYAVELIVTNGNGCKDTLDNTITINPLPVITASGDTVICLGDAAQISAIGGVSYTWAPAANLSCVSCQSTSAAPQAATAYVVTGTDANGCSNTDTAKVNIKTKTTAAAGQGGEICDANSIVLHASGGDVYAWSPPEHLDNSHISDPTASPHATTRYMVVVKEASCQPDSDYVTVTVHPRPHLYAGEDRSIVAGSSTQLTLVGSDFVSYEWSYDPTLSCTQCPTPTATPITTTTYTVSGVSDWGCHDSDKVTITVLCDQSQAFVPNSFTPNGDGENDIFYPRGTGITKIKSFRVYDRWGELVFERTGININDEQNGWDGTYKGAALSPDVYVYVIEVICQTGEQLNLKGDITIIR